MEPPDHAAELDLASAASLRQQLQQYPQRAER
jgi:hypothetical protein